MNKVASNEKTQIEKKNGLSLVSINLCFNLTSSVLILFCANAVIGRERTKEER